MESILRLGRKIIPRKIFEALQPIYHRKLAFLAAITCGFPSRKLNVVAITGTKGKSSTVEFVNSILETAGYKTAVLGTIRFKIGEKSQPNLHKMTVPGRFFVQKFLRNAVNSGCEYAILEMTSEAIKQHRHKFIDLDALIFLNLAPEHIESHGSYEKYVQAKLALAELLTKSRKKRKLIVVNSDDKEAPRFLSIPIKEKYPFSIRVAEPFTLSSNESEFYFHEERITLHVPGQFNIYNALAAATFALTQNISLQNIREGLERIHEIPGRVQKIKVSPDQDFTVIVDYAHTTDSLEKLYQTFSPLLGDLVSKSKKWRYEAINKEATHLETKSPSPLPGKKRLICVLGNTGGGRDKWKRVEMAKIADTYCDSIILTNEDPYDDNPREIVEDMRRGIKTHTAKIIMDRRDAIRDAIGMAEKGDTVLITGKGTDPYIMGPIGSKIPWSDQKVVKEELARLFETRS